ncbi:MAG TPA: pseudouridine synthase [Polyangiaceae bacterium]|nr:pseudouridine synthase [Polyangiaceae bacterium]
MERLQKVLARAGIASRRAAEQIILAGRVRVDGKIVRELGTQVDERRSRVEVDGTKIVAEKLVYIVLHKPRGVVCTLSDPEGRPTIKELLKDAGARVVPVGRLDFHTSGALLCTNDGEFAQGLAHPKKEVPKVYVAKVKGTVDDDALPRFSQSIEIEGRRTAPAQVKRLRYEGDKTWLEITLREGRNRQVRKLGEFTGFPVMRLARVSHAGVTSEDLRPGQWRPLTVDELIQLKKDFGVPKKVRPPQLAWDAGKTERTERTGPRAGVWAKEKTARGQSRSRAGERGKAVFQTEGEARGPAQGERFSNRNKSPYRGERGETRGPAGGARSPSRKAPFQGERAQTTRHEEPNRPWRSRSRSAIEARPENNRGLARGAKSSTFAGRTKRSAEETRAQRPSADRGSSRKGRRTH